MRPILNEIDKVMGENAALRAEGRLAVERLTEVANLREGQNEKLRSRVAELEKAPEKLMEDARRAIEGEKRP
jgi:hypothetical protein